MRLRWLALAVIVTVVSGCDNVVWEGVDTRLEPPPSRAELAVSGPGSESGRSEDESFPELPDGPVLLAGIRDGSSATLAVVGEIRGDTVAPLPSEAESPGFRERFANQRLAPGTELILFSEGVRIGRLTASETGVDSTFCLPRPTVRGTVELVPAASAAQRFLAIPAVEAGSRPYGAYETLGDDYNLSDASIDLASAAIVTVSAPWPPSLRDARADLRIFQLPDDDEPMIAATFLHQDELAVAEPGEGAYSLFVVGRPGDGRYHLAYTGYRRADDEGKGSPRFFDRLDWNGDGDTEILLDVYGAESRWFAGLSRSGDSWSRSFQDPCASGSASPDD